MIKNKKSSYFILILFSLFCFTPYSSSATGLFSGIYFSLLFSNPFELLTKKYSPYLLQLSIVLVGANMNLLVLKDVGLEGIQYTFLGILSTFVLGFILNKFLNIKQKIAHLIVFGTAICGGSAIAALGPIIKADSDEMTVSLTVVFILNAIALLLFPAIGHELNLSQYQFGLWSALAIHDTSSVVGASMSYGKEALFYATTIKLARALWILPVSLLFALLIHSKSKIKIPWFIFLFIIMSAIFTIFPQLNTIGGFLGMVAKKLLVFSLMLVGLNINFKAIKKLGIKPMIFAIIIWLIVGGTSLLLIKQNMIS
jgi:uncharacterized integral membrane protein (TIGR00698 family)